MLLTIEWCNWWARLLFGDKWQWFWGERLHWNTKSIPMMSLWVAMKMRDLVLLSFHPPVSTMDQLLVSKIFLKCWRMIIKGAGLLIVQENLFREVRQIDVRSWKLVIALWQLIELISLGWVMGMWWISLRNQDCMFDWQLAVLKSCRINKWRLQWRMMDSLLIPASLVSQTIPSYDSESGTGDVSGLSVHTALSETKKRILGTGQMKVLSK